MRRLAICIPLILLCTQVFAQRIDGVHKLKGIPQANYGLYFPSSYVPGKSLPVMIAFHPLGTRRWDGIKWRDHLTSFAERNQVFLICPDGGEDGNFRLKEDLDFVKLLVMTMLDKYDVHPTCIYAMGLGQGANAALELAVHYPNFVNGLMLLGVNFQGLNLSQHSISRTFNLPCYIIQSKGDQLQLKYYPLKKFLNQSGACVKTHMIEKLGPSFSLPNRHYILTQAFNWLEGVNCDKPESVWKENQYMLKAKRELRPTIRVAGLEVLISNIPASQSIRQISVYDYQGLLIRVIRNPEKNTSFQLPVKGHYTIAFQSQFSTNRLRLDVGTRY